MPQGWVSLPPACGCVSWTGTLRSVVDWQRTMRLPRHEPLPTTLALFRGQRAQRFASGPHRLLANGQIARASLELDCRSRTVAQHFDDEFLRRLGALALAPVGVPDICGQRLIGGDCDLFRLPFDGHRVGRLLVAGGLLHEVKGEARMIVAQIVLRREK